MSRDADDVLKKFSMSAFVEYSCIKYVGLACLSDEGAKHLVVTHTPPEMLAPSILE